MDGKIGDRRAEIYTYESDNIVYGLSWSVSHFFQQPESSSLAAPAAQAVLLLCLVVCQRFPAWWQGLCITAASSLPTVCSIRVLQRTIRTAYPYLSSH